ncbi:MAG: hypothetical protein IJ074_09905 [Clostridia bacterium]|nr:hypothetical protein [Clostridia bacterium]
MMEISFIKLSPTQNMTVLILSDVADQRRAEVAARLLAYDSVFAEQAGYVLQPSKAGANAALQMMGGEFCGNATMSLAAYLAEQERLVKGETREYQLQVSGTDELVPCRIKRLEDGYEGTVKMPLPLGTRKITLATDCGVVQAKLISFSGIAHIVLPISLGVSSEEAERRLPQWNEEIGADALGALIVNESTLEVHPVVYVPAIQTVTHERGCGSGAAAIACDQLYSTGGTHTRVEVRQPGGVICAEVFAEGGTIRDLTIQAKVCIVARGIAYI